MTAISDTVFREQLESLYVYLATQKWDMSTISDHMSLLYEYEPREVKNAIERQQIEDLR